MTRQTIFVTGATGYIGSALVSALLARGHCVRALVRAESAHWLPAGAQAVIGNALDAGSFEDAIAPAETLVHLIGTPHPSPAKAASFQSVDLVSVGAALNAARSAGIQHFVYLSVAHPAPMMHAYIAVRMQGEARIVASGIAATFVRPWYVLGPGHRWPYVLLPFYAILSLFRPTRDSAERLGLVTLGQMVTALVACIEQGASGVRIMDVPGIRGARLTASASD